MLLTSLRPRAQRGFTLIELMVAGLVASILIAILMAIMLLASRTAETQEDATQTVDRLYYAMAMLDRDLSTAGYGVAMRQGLVSRDSTELRPTFCGGVALMPVNLVDGGSRVTAIDASADPNNTAMRLQPDRLRITGALGTTVVFSNQDSTSGRTNGFTGYSANGSADSTVTLTLPSGAGDDWGELPYEPPQRVRDAVDRGFLAVMNQGGGVRHHDVATGSATFAGSNVTARIKAVGTGAQPGACQFDEQGVYFVSVLNQVEYEVIDVPAGLAGGQGLETLLVRHELRSDGTIFRTVPVARNIVDFQVWFDGVDGSGAIDRDGDTTAEMVDTQGTLTSLAFPERARVAYVQLTARTDSETAGLVRQALDAGGLQSSVDVDGDPSSSARLVTIRFQVALNSLAMAAVEES